MKAKDLPGKDLFITKRITVRKLRLQSVVSLITPRFCQGKHFGQKRFHRRTFSSSQIQRTDRQVVVRSRGSEVGEMGEGRETKGTNFQL